MSYVEHNSLKNGKDFPPFSSRVIAEGRVAQLYAVARRAGLCQAGAVSLRGNSQLNARLQAVPSTLNYMIHRLQASRIFSR